MGERRNSVFSGGGPLRRATTAWKRKRSRAGRTAATGQRAPPRRSSPGLLFGLLEDEETSRAVVESTIGALASSREAVVTRGVLAPSGRAMDRVRRGDADGARGGRGPDAPRGGAARRVPAVPHRVRASPRRPAVGRARVRASLSTSSSGCRDGCVQKILWGVHALGAQHAAGERGRRRSARHGLLRDERGACRREGE